MITKSILGSVLALGAFAQIASASPSQLTSEQWLMPGQTIASSCYYRATMQLDGNFLLSSNGTSTPYWSTGTAGSGGYARMESNGNFSIFNWADSAVWTAFTWGQNYNARVVMQNDGELVIYNTGNSAVWWTGTAGEVIGSNSCAGSNFAKTQVYFGWNASGGDYTHFPMAQARPSWCAYYCSQDARCNAFTYVPPGIQGSQPVCWLKDRGYIWYSDNRLTSGIIMR